MTDQQQKDFVDMIQKRIVEKNRIKNAKSNFGNSDIYWLQSNLISELEWVLEQFNNIKSK